MRRLAFNGPCSSLALVLDSYTICTPIEIGFGETFYRFPRATNGLLSAVTANVPYPFGQYTVGQVIVERRDFGGTGRVLWGHNRIAKLPRLHFPETANGQGLRFWEKKG